MGAASRQTGPGNEFYHNTIHGSALLHYRRGGLEVDTNLLVVNAEGNLKGLCGPPDSVFIPESARENQRWKDRVIEKMQGSAVLAKVTVDGRKACS